MKVLTYFSQLQCLKDEGCVVTIGNFDGLHIAHRKIFTDLKAAAKKKKAKTLVITFARDNETMTSLRCKPLLTSLDHKLLLMQEMGIDYCFVFKLSPRLQSIAAVDFLNDVLFKKFPIKRLVVGYNFRFGKDRVGCTRLIREFAAARHIECHIENEMRYKAACVSSTRIRSLVAEGELRVVASLLKRHYSVLAEVVSGAGRGTSLGFPTANLHVYSEVLPPCGVYMVKVSILDIVRKKDSQGEILTPHFLKKDVIGVLNIGFTPTFVAQVKGNTVPIVEVHILDYAGDIRGKMVEVMFYKRVREERGYSSVDELCAQIDVDIRQTRKYFC